MIRIITVEREYGSQGAEYAMHLARKLNWKLIDHCLIEEIAHKAGITSSLAEQYDERLDPWYYRVGKAFWHGSLERLPGIPDAEVFDSERMVGFVKNALLEATEKGNCVVVGRGASCVLSGVPGVFHVFVYASMARRMRWFEKNFPEQAKISEQEILATDKRRAAYIRRFYDRDWTDRHIYQLMMNSCMGFDAMVGATIEAAGLVQAAEQQHVG
ncbi:MAG TPA: cytidylate kinase-like family protein [Acidisarcina sp.]|nr:cytidylate kinase-like family protein [Acidisarcina sp.]